MEGWRPISEFVGQYEVSDEGRVRSLPRVTPDGKNLKGRVLKECYHSSGYPVVGLSKDGVARNYYIHRLVLEAFVGKCPEGYIACHRDDDPTNNRLENLRWGSYSDNGVDAVNNGRHHLADRLECSHGHEYTDENTYMWKGPSGRFARVCRECKRNDRARHKDKGLSDA